MSSWDRLALTAHENKMGFMFVFMLLMPIQGILKCFGIWNILFKWIFLTLPESFMYILPFFLFLFRENLSKKSLEKQPKDFKKDGKIYRLQTQDDSEEDNNTWNGNSTQQM